MVFGVCGFAMLLLCVLAAAPIADWQYRWGETGEWAALKLPAHAPHADGDLWQRAVLPPGTWKDPALKLDAVIGQFELFADGERIYAHPPEGLDAKGVAGLPWHLVALPPGAREVALHVRTSYRLAGIQAVPQLGERSDLMEDVVRTDTPKLVVGALMLLLAVLGALLMPARLGWSFALYTGSSGLYSIYYTQLKQVVMPLTPGIWFFIWLVTLAMLPIGFLQFLIGVLHEPPRGVVLMRRVHVVYGALFVAVMMVSWVAMYVWGRAAEQYLSPMLFITGGVLRVLMVVTGGVGVWHVVKLARGPGPDRDNARLLLASFAVLLGALLLNVGAAFGLLPTMRGAYVSPGLFALTLALAVIGQRAWATTRLELADRVKEKEAMLRDLHDGIGGVTTNIRLLAELGRKDTQKAMDALAAIAELSTEGLAELRAFTQTLDEGEAQVTWPIFFSELRRFGGQLIESHGKAFNLNARVDGDGRPRSALCLTVLRIFREALTNVVKHAGATRVDVDIVVTRARLTLKLTDDGTGTGTGGGLDTGRGVANMKARAKDLGGELTVLTGPNTQLSLVVPLP